MSPAEKECEQEPDHMIELIVVFSKRCNEGHNYGTSMRYKKATNIRRINFRFLKKSKVEKSRNVIGDLKSKKYFIYSNKVD